MSSWVGMAGAAVQGYARYEQGIAQKEELDYNARVAENKAIAVMYAMKNQLAVHKKAVFRIIDETRAGAVAAGVQLSGTPLEVIMEAAREGEYEQRMIEYEANLRALGLREEADLLRYQGRTAKEIGKIAAVGTALSGGASAYQPTQSRTEPAETKTQSGYKHHRSDEKH